MYGHTMLTASCPSDNKGHYYSPLNTHCVVPEKINALNRQFGFLLFFKNSGF